MATPTSYVFQQAHDIYSLTTAIESADIIVALSHIEVTDSVTTIIFKDVLSQDEETILNNVVSSYEVITPPPRPPSEVITQMEKDDKILVLLSAEGEFVNDISNIEIEIPGTPGEIGLYVKEGYGFTDAFAWGTRVTRVALVDKNYIFAGTLYPAEPEPGVTWAQAMPDGVELGDYCNRTGLNDVNKGWRLWCEEGGQGGVDIDNLAGYGHLLSGCFLQIRFVKPTGSTPQYVAVNLQCGRANE